MDDDTVHVMPINDLIEHESSGDCACGPRTEIVQRDDAPDGHLYVHHSLDGREMGE